MKKRYWLIGAGVVLILAAGGMLLKGIRMSVNIEDDGSAVSIIGGADGPTSVFIAGKIGGDDDVAEYSSITMEDAKEIFSQAGDYIILDVRRADEFAEGHIPGAINIANEDIGDSKPEALADVNQVIYVYCRSGRRSKEASAKLAALGYTNIVECGGILDWTGETEK